MTPRPPQIRRTQLILALMVGALLVVWSGIAAHGAAAFTANATCALPGTDFQGGDGNQDLPSVAEQSFCNEHLLSTARDWQGLGNVVNSPDPQSADSMFAGGNKESAPGNWFIESSAGGVTPGKANILSGWSQADPQAAATFLYLAFERAATTGDTFLTFELNQV